MSRNLPSGKAALIIYSYFVCVKRSVAVIYPTKVDLANKANFIRPNHIHNKRCVPNIKNVLNSMCV